MPRLLRECQQTSLERWLHWACASCEWLVRVLDAAIEVRGDLADAVGEIEGHGEWRCRLFKK